MLFFRQLHAIRCLKVGHAVGVQAPGRSRWRSAQSLPSSTRQASTQFSLITACITKCTLTGLQQPSIMCYSSGWANMVLHARQMMDVLLPPRRALCEHAKCRREHNGLLLVSTTGASCTPVHCMSMLRYVHLGIEAFAACDVSCLELV